MKTEDILNKLVFAPSLITNQIYLIYPNKKSKNKDYTYALHKRDVTPFVISGFLKWFERENKEILPDGLQPGKGAQIELSDGTNTYEITIKNKKVK